MALKSALAIAPFTPFTGILQGTPEVRDDFWNVKPRADWSTDEIARLTTSSPWAVKTRVKMAGKPQDLEPLRVASSAAASANQSAPSSSRSSGRGHPLDDIVPGPPAPKNTSSTAIAFYGEVVITWESAEPIRLARDEPLPSEFRDHYAVRVTGLPAATFMSDSGRTPLVFRLLGGTTLEVNSRKREPSDYVLPIPRKKSILFAFPVTRFPLTEFERFISFSMNLNEMVVSSRFDLRLMKFRDSMAL